FITAGYGEASFGFKEFAVGVEKIQQGRYATGVAQVRKAGAIAQGFDQGRTLRANLFHFLIGNQRIRDFTKRSLDRSLVIDDQKITLRFGETYVRLQPAGG